MTKYKITLITMFIIGLPSIPFGIMMWLIRRYIVQDKTPLTKEDWIAFNFACSLIGLIYLAFYLTGTP